jgi:type I restriction enzyme M protein
MKDNKNGANLGFENQLWAAADKLRGHMEGRGSQKITTES